VTQEHFNSKPFCHMAGKRNTTSLVLNWDFILPQDILGESKFCDALHRVQ